MVQKPWQRDVKSPFPPSGNNRLGAYGRLITDCGRLVGDCNPLGKWQRFAGEHDSGVIPWNLHIWDPFRSLHMEPSPLLVLTDSSNEGLAPDAPPRLAAEGMEQLDRVYSKDSLKRY